MKQNESGPRATRRAFVKDASLLLLGLGLSGSTACRKDANEPIEPTGEPGPAALSGELFFKISLAQWSLHRSFREQELDVRDFAAIARSRFRLGAVEYVNGFYEGKAEDVAYLNDLRARADDHDVESLLIMVDDEGELGSTNDASRREAVENHHKWVDAAKVLGCHSIRVNAFGEGSREDVRDALVDGLGRLGEYAGSLGINVLIENHGLYSSDARWVASVLDQVNRPNCGTLPDFGNFCVARKWGSTQDGTCPEVYDRYQGVEEMLPYAKGVSAKSYAFDEEGNETTIDFHRMLRLVKSAGFSGHVGIEYEGSQLSEMEGIEATRRLLIAAGADAPR